MAGHYCTSSDFKNTLAKVSSNKWGRVLTFRCRQNLQAKAALRFGLVVVSAGGICDTVDTEVISGSGASNC
jgi:hypothetical protein